MLAPGRLVVAALDGRGLPNRDDRAAVSRLAVVVDAGQVVALVERACCGCCAALAGSVEQCADELPP
jgi:hypothetical protein